MHAHAVDRAWDAVQAQIDGNGASQYSAWMQASNVDTGGSTEYFIAWWPGASHVDIVGLDGYPQSDAGWGLCNFQELFGQSFTEMESLPACPSSSPRPTWPRSAY